MPESKILDEGIASEHPDISGQNEFAKKADEVIARRKKERRKKSGPQLPDFIKTVRKEEVEPPKERLKTDRDMFTIPKTERDAARERLLTKAKAMREKKGIKNEEFVSERAMTSTERKKESSLKSKYDDSGMKKRMVDLYGQEKGRQVYFAYIRKKAMGEGFIDSEDEILTSSGRPGRKPIENFDFNEVYDYILESLVEYDYAADYDSAEIMFEHISIEFTSVLLEQYLEEKARGTRKKSTVHAYDVDETLFAHGKGKKPNVQVHVKDESGKKVQSLSNQEYNTHKLKPGHSYDYSEFGSAKKFRETSTPNKKVVKHIKKKIARGENVHLITARSKFDNPHEFHAHLQSHGINVPMKNIHYTGGMKGGDVGDKKVRVANAIAKMHGASKVHMYDDAAKVHKSFEAEKKQNPVSKKIKTHLIKPDKSGESNVRSYQATKEEMTSYGYWKQFIDEKKK